MCFKDSNVEYLDQPARQSSSNNKYTTNDATSEATTILVPPSDAKKEAKAAAKAAAKAERKAVLERNAAIRRKTMYGAGGGAAFIGSGAGC
ncbi:hypothetical protein TWF281_000665 [Arthrobotrys megalospora]